MAVQSSFKKTGFHEKFDFEFIFSTTFEAVLYIFRKDYPGTEIIVSGQEKNNEESDPEDDANNQQNYYKEYKNEDEFFATQI